MKKRIKSLIDVAKSKKKSYKKSCRCDDLESCSVCRKRARSYNNYAGTEVYKLPKRKKSMSKRAVYMRNWRAKKVNDLLNFVEYKSTIPSSLGWVLTYKN